MAEKRVLFVDNHQAFLDTQAELLENEGYVVLKAGSVEEARHLLRNRRVHLAVLDIRMMNDNDSKDVSGLALAKDADLRAIPKLVLTAYPDYETAREALGPVLDGMPATVDYIAKKEGPLAMIKAVGQAFERWVHINTALTIRWADALSFTQVAALVYPELDGEALVYCAGELEDLFRQIFRDKTQVTIGRLLSRKDDRPILEAFAYTEKNGEEQCVISLGRRQVIEDETDRYEGFVRKQTASGNVQQLPMEQTVNFAATRYILMEGQLDRTRPFGIFYAESSLGEVEAALNHLYSTTLMLWYQKTRGYEKGAALDVFYRQWLALDADVSAADSADTLRPQVEALCRESQITGLARIEHSLRKVDVHFPGGASFSCFSPLAYLSIEYNAPEASPLYGVTHGTVDADSVLVDDRQRTWLIDFTKTGHGPLLRDFISLEMAIRLDLLVTTDLQARYEFEQRLLALSDLQEDVGVEGLSPELAKALGSIAHIRHLAARLAGPQPEAYLLGVYYCALARLLPYDPTVRHTRREIVPFAHSLLLAALVADKLATGSAAMESLPLQAHSALWIDDANRDVWVQGRRVDVTPQEYDILAYLYQHAGQLCTREAIVEEALGEEYQQAATETSRLNSAISRLRQKIEPDADNPTYIVTERGYGYRLAV